MVAPTAAAMRGQHQLGLGDRSQRHEDRALRVAIIQLGPHRDRQPGLADAAGAGEGDQPDSGRLQQLRDIGDVVLAPDQRRRGHRQRARDPPATARRGGCRTSRAAVSGREPLAQKHGEIVTDQPPELARATERSVGVGSLGLELVDHGRQPCFSVGRRCLDVQQAGHRRGEPELVLQARDVHVRPDPAVPLPVQTDEDVGLGQISPVQLPRRVRSGPELEQHRREPRARRWRATPRRAPSASSPSVELTKTRRRWSGVRMAASLSFSVFTLRPGGSSSKSARASPGRTSIPPRRSEHQSGYATTPEPRHRST